MTDTPAPVTPRRIKFDRSKLVTRAEVTQYGGLERALAVKNGTLVIPEPEPSTEEFDLVMDDTGYFCRKVKRDAT